MVRVAYPRFVHFCRLETLGAPCGILIDKGKQEWYFVLELENLSLQFQ